MDVLNEVRREWEAHRDSIEKRIKGWIDCLTDRDTRERIIKARQSFHQWEPLRVYISASQAMRKGEPSFSLRYGGQEVGNVIFQNGTPYVSVSKTTQLTNARDFQVRPDTHTRFPWDSPDGQMFRKHFKSLTAERTSARRSREHFLESTIIREMRMKTNAKFDKILNQIQPVLLYGILPFQVPLPFSASTGNPECSDHGGNIDILARRRGKDGQVRLSVWELKRPGAIDHAVAQSCIYTAVLRHLLRSSSGSEWYKLFGFRRELPEPPESLEIEAVVLLSESKRRECAAQVEELRNSREATLGGDRISLSVAFYDDKTLRLTHFEEGKAVLL